MLKHVNVHICITHNCIESPWPIVARAFVQPLLSGRDKPLECFELSVDLYKLLRAPTRRRAAEALIKDIGDLVAAFVRVVAVGSLRKAHIRLYVSQAEFAVRHSSRLQALCNAMRTAVARETQDNVITVLPSTGCELILVSTSGAQIHDRFFNTEWKQAVGSLEFHERHTESFIIIVITK